MGPLDRIRRLPKVDLHVHLEGSLPGATLVALASRHRLRVPQLRHFNGLTGFLRSFGAVCDLLADREDFERAAGDLLNRARRLGVAHLEVLFSPQVFLRRGISLASIIDALLRARSRAMREHGQSIVYILDGVRQWGGEWFDEVVRTAAPYVGRGLAAVGVGGDETTAPLRDFARAFRRARQIGLATTVHAGEAAGAESVRDALQELRVDRIGHGVRAAEDARLVSDLAGRGVPLEVCPSSNIATGIYPSLERHPVRRLFDAGVNLTINSDDGAFFDTDVRQEQELLASRLSFSEGEILQLTLNAARASFLPHAAKRRLERRILRSARDLGIGQRIREAARRTACG